MSSSKTDVVNAMYEAVFAGDWEKYRSCIHPDFTLLQSAGTPYPGSYRGIEGLQEVFGKVMARFEIFEVSQVAMTEGADHVIVLVDLELKGRQQPGTHLNQIAEVFRFIGDKVVEVKPFYWDQAMLSNI